MLKLYIYITLAYIYIRLESINFLNNINLELFLDPNAK